MGWEQDLYGNVYKSQKTKNAAAKRKKTNEAKAQSQAAAYDRAFTSGVQSYAQQNNLQYSDDLKNAAKAYYSNQDVRDNFMKKSVNESKARNRAELKSYASFAVDHQSEINDYNDARKKMGLQPDSMVTKKKYDQMFGYDTKKGTDNGMFNRYQDYITSKDLKVNHNDKTAPKKGSLSNGDSKKGLLDTYIDQVKKTPERLLEYSGLEPKVKWMTKAGKFGVETEDRFIAAPTRNITSSALDKKVQPKKDITDAWKNEHRASGEEIVKKLGVDNKVGQKIGGFVAEALLDPTNLIGAGVGGKMLKTASKVSKLGKEADILKTVAEKGVKKSQVKDVLDAVNRLAEKNKANELPDISTLPKNHEGLYLIKDEYPMQTKMSLQKANEIIKNGVQPTNQAELIKQIDESPKLQNEINQMNQEHIASVKEPTHMNIDAAPKLNPKTAPLSKVTNVESKPLPTEFDAVKHISEQISDNVKPEKHPIMQRLKDLGNRVYYNMVDDRHGIGRLDKAAKKNVDDYDSAIALSHQAAGSGSKATQALEKGIYNVKGEKVGEGFKEILQQAKDPEKLQQYLVAKSSLDYDSKGMTAFDSKGFNQKEISTAAINKLEKEHPGIKEEANRVYKFIEQQQQVLKDGGMLNDKQIAQMKKENPNYVGMQRLQDDGIESFTKGNESLKKRLMNVGKPTNKRTGSKKQIINPLETIVKRQYVYQNMADRNKPGIAILNHLRSMPEDNVFGNIVDVEKNANYKLLNQADEVANHSEDEINNGINDLFREKDGKNNILYVYENGDKYKVQVKDKLLFDSIMSMDSKSLPVWMKAINAPVKMLRAGVTLSPDFGLRNVIRDQLTTAISSKRGYVPGLDALKGAAEIIKGRKGNSSLIHAYIKNGGDMSVLQNIDRTNVIKTYQDLQGNKPLMSKLKEVAKDPSKLLEPLRKIGEFSEQSTRIGHMKKAIKKGASPEQAAYDARSTMDFNRAGAWGRQINQVAAFFNASVQGLDITARSMAKRPLKTSLAIGGYIVAPTIALYKLNQNQQWFKDLPPDERDRNWFMKLPGEDGQIIKIPKPFEVGILFGAGTERALDKGEHSFDGYLKEVYDTMTPDVLPTVLKPWLEVMTNHNLFTGQSIESMGDQYLPAEQRKTAYNSQFASKTSEILSKLNKRNEISPKDIDHLVRGYTGTLGSYVNEGVDTIAGLVNSKIPDKPSRGVQTMPFIRSFVQRNLEGNNKPTNDFYQLHDDLQTMSKREGFKYGIQQKSINRVFTQVNKLQSAKKDILNSNQINGKDKAQQIKELNKKITEMARKAYEQNKIKR